MKRDGLTERMARQRRTSQAEEADRLDRVVHDLIQKLRRGEKATLPGLGELAGPRKDDDKEGSPA